MSSGDAPAPGRPERPAGPTGRRGPGGAGRALARLGRGARRIGAGLRSLPRLVLLALVLLTAVAATAVWRGTGPDTPAEPGIGQVYRVGVEPDASVPEYLDRSRRELAVLAASPGQGPAYALVSFDGYERPDALGPLLAGVDPVRLYARVPLPHVQTEIVHFPVYRLPDDAVTGMADAARRKDRSADGYRRRAATAAAADRDGYARSAAVAQQEAAAYRQPCACVYAAVVRGTPQQLVQLAGRAGVRAVDPAAQLPRLAQAVFLPPLPEQTDRAGAPADDPSDAGVTSATPSPAR